MNKKDRKLLLGNRLAFVENVEAEDLLGHLFQDGVLSENDKEKIEIQATRRDRIELLLDTLPRKGPKAFTKFCAVLNRFEGYKYLADILDPSAESGDAVDAPPSIPNIRSTSLCNIKSDSSTGDDSSYVMNSHPRSWCFILNNIHFYQHADREGSEKDGDNLRDLFTTLGFRVWVVNDADCEDIRDNFRLLADKSDHGDCLVVCILSHGLEGQIYGVDGGLVRISEILDILNRGSAKTLLQGKPKLMLIQACRNAVEKTPNHKDINKEIDSFQVINGGCVEQVTRSPYDSFVEESVVQTHRDLLLAYSTFPGHVSWRHPLNGSFFVDAVVRVFREFSATEDVLSLFVRVNATVREMLEGGAMEQVPAPVFTLTKKWFLQSP